MKDKIFSKLKLTYSPLGLGDDVLQALSESLASLGLVNDENIEDVVGKQKGYLEGLQKANDKRVSAALAKFREKQLEEGGNKGADGGVSDSVKALIQQMEETYKGTIESLGGKISELEKASAEREKADAAAKRNAFILAKAKELNIPQYRIDEGFSIPSDASEEAITNQLSTIANNITSHVLPPRGGYATPKGDPSNEDVSKIAENLIKSIN